MVLSEIFIINNGVRIAAALPIVIFTSSDVWGGGQPDCSACALLRRDSHSIYVGGKFLGCSQTVLAKMRRIEPNPRLDNA